jgi:signal peptidase I
VIIFGVILLIYILMSLTLRKVFEKAGVPAWKALVPGINFIEICKLIGQPTSHAAWMLFPIVNIFTYAGMKVDLVRSFGKFSFGDSFWAVVFSPFVLNKIGNDNSKYEGEIVPKEKAFMEELRQAQTKKDERAIKKLDNSPYKKGPLREWVEAIVFAVFAAAFIRMFLIEAYVIPTSSMEGSLLIGDYLFVSKAHYGIRTPMTVLQVPLLHNSIPVINTESYIKEPSFGYHRLPALQSVQRNEPFVFNWPAGDSSYVDIEGSYMYNMDFIRAKPGLLPQLQAKGIDLTVRPVDKRDHYIKRCVALPGDVFEIKDRIVYINGQAQAQPENVQFNYLVKGSFNPDKLREMGINLTSDAQMVDKNVAMFALSSSHLKQLQEIGYSTELYARQEIDKSLFPQDTVHFKWSIDNYGPITMPKTGETVQLSMDNIALYWRIIKIYENNNLEFKNNEIFINGSKATSYTFKQNYYWAVGDNRHNSQDSRFWGFVPEDHVVGKPLFIWFSKGELGIRWNRIFTSAVKH